MKKALLGIIVIIIFLLSACYTPKTNSEVDFVELNISDVFNIKKIELSDSLSSKCKSYSFSYNVEGVSVDGFISIPSECNMENPHKCILYNRGGNSNFGFLRDTDTARISAQTNRIVIASQYRAEDQFGGNDIEDVIKLIDICENLSFADMSDFTAIGVSRGGMMSYMAARADNRIKRIISISGVSNLIQAYNDRDDMKKVLNNFIGGSPDELLLEYEKRSAIFWADEIKVPTLIIHSLGDNQVSYSQAEEMYNALLDNGTDVTLKTYTDSTHGLHSEDVEIIADWLG